MSQLRSFEFFSCVIQRYEVTKKAYICGSIIGSDKVTFFVRTVFLSQQRSLERMRSIAMLTSTISMLSFRAMLPLNEVELLYDLEICPSAMKPKYRTTCY